MIQGVLIAESLRTETTLDDLKIVVSKITRFRPPVTTPIRPASGRSCTLRQTSPGQRTWLTCWPAPSPNRGGMRTSSRLTRRSSCSRVGCFAMHVAMRVAVPRLQSAAGRSTSPKYSWTGPCEPACRNSGNPHLASGRSGIV